MSLAEARQVLRRRRDQTPRRRRFRHDPYTHGGVAPRARAAVQERGSRYRRCRFRRSQPLEGQRGPTTTRTGALAGRLAGSTLRIRTITDLASANRTRACSAAPLFVGTLADPRHRSPRTDRRSFARGEPVCHGPGEPVRHPARSRPRGLYLPRPADLHRGGQCLARPAAGRRRSGALSAAVAVGAARAGWACCSRRARWCWRRPCWPCRSSRRSCTAPRPISGPSTATRCRSTAQRGCAPFRICSRWRGASVLTAVLAGFGRTISEVGAILVVGGNIAGYTRTMTTAIVLETSKGNLVARARPRFRADRDQRRRQRDHLRARRRRGAMVVRLRIRSGDPGRA